LNKVDKVMTALKVLVIDDSPMTIKIMESILNELGHEIVGTEHSGERALETYRACKPDLVTMDIVMPVVDGIEATKRIIAEFPDAKIIIVSAYGQETIVQDTLKWGARGYVTKPVKAEELEKQIKLAIESNN
jgi:two-component system chemotaxis response regulator CheY